MSVQSMGKMGKDFCPNVVQPFLENIDRRSCNDGSRELFPISHNPHRKGQPSRVAVARALEYLVGVPSKAASSGRKTKNKFGSISKRLLNILKAVMRSSCVQGSVCQVWVVD